LNFQSFSNFLGFKTAKIALLDPDPGADLNPDPIRIRDTGYQAEPLLALAFVIVPYFFA
jgi:hypothetical protein